MDESAIPAEHSAQSSWQSWLEEIQSIGTTNPLKNFEPNTFGQIDLDRAHPGGLAQFASSGQALLSNLIRDPLSYSRALATARRIKAKTDRLQQDFGIRTSYLAGGLIGMEADGFDLRLPILLWPLSITAKSDSYELALTGPPQVNPILIEAFRANYSISLREIDLYSMTQQGTDLIPISLLKYLADVAGPGANLDIKRVLVVGTFAPAALALEKDFHKVESFVLSRLAGAADKDFQLVDESDLPLVPVLVADANEVQQRVVARGLAGESFAVETLPGCGYTQTVANLVAALMHSGKRVLVLAPRRQSLNELTERFSALGLAGLGIRTSDTWLDTISAISRNEKAQPGVLGEAKQRLVNAEGALRNYFDLLNRVDAELAISIGETLENLARLSAITHPPLTSARLERDKLNHFEDRTTAIQLLQEANSAGLFKFGPQDTAWFQARFENSDEVESTLAVVKRLIEENFPKLSSQLADFVANCNFEPAYTVEDWGRYLKLFIGVRDTLDRFIPDVYDRPLTELIEATGPRQANSSMSGGTRRRLKKLAKEYLRPGSRVSDMHGALKAIQEQRDLWGRYSLSPIAPQVPLGIADAESAYREFVRDLAEVQSHLDPESDEPKLSELPLHDLRAKLNSLNSDTEVLENLVEQSIALNRLRALGMGDLARDLAKLHVPRERLTVEFELAWWQTALEVLLERTPQFFEFNAESIDQLEDAYCVADREVIQNGAQEIASRLAERWNIAISGFADQTGAFREMLKTRRATVAEAHRIAPDVWAAIAPVILASPYEVPTAIPPEIRFDVVIALDAAGSSVAENLAGLSRATQVIAFGDDAIAAPTGFDIECRSVTLEPSILAPSLFQEMRRLFGVESLTQSYRTGGQVLGEFISREFYQNRLRFLPTSDEYFGKTHVRVETVSENNRASSTIEGANESLEAEVSRVVQLVLDHATYQPEQSLLVASASQIHADRIAAAVEKTLEDKPQIAEFFDSHGREKFEITSLADLSHRVADHIIFSVGFGRTPHGAVLSSFGQLSSSEGKRYLTNLLVSARKSVTLVSCFEPNDLPSDRLSNGAQYLKDLLLAATESHLETELVEADPLLQDLALRLKKLGIMISAKYAPKIALAASFGATVAAIEPDWVLSRGSWREKIRLRRELLSAMGWQRVRVHAFELFSNPQDVAHRIAEQLGLEIFKQPQVLFENTPVAFEDTPMAWGENSESNDQDLRDNKPPHWS